VKLFLSKEEIPSCFGSTFFFSGSLDERTSSSLSLIMVRATDRSIARSQSISTVFPDPSSVLLVLCVVMQRLSSPRRLGRPWILLQQRLYLRYTIPSKEIQFLCSNVYHLKRQWRLMEKYFPNANDGTLDKFLGKSAYAAHALLPFDALADSEGEEQPAVVAGSPPGLKSVYQRIIGDGEWLELCSPVEYGGQNLPASLSVLTNEILASASLSVSVIMVWIDVASLSFLLFLPLFLSASLCLCLSVSVCLSLFLSLSLSLSLSVCLSLSLSLCLSLCLCLSLSLSLSVCLSLPLSLSLSVS
jgi:hypothetical protein